MRLCQGIHVIFLPSAVSQPMANAAIAPYLHRITCLTAEVERLQLDVATLRQAALQQECQAVKLVINVQQPQLANNSQEQQTAPERQHAASEQHEAPAPAAPSRQPATPAPAPAAALPPQPAADSRSSRLSTAPQQQPRLPARSSSTGSAAWVFRDNRVCSRQRQRCSAGFTRGCRGTCTLLGVFPFFMLVFCFVARQHQHPFVHLRFVLGFSFCFVFVFSFLLFACACRSRWGPCMSHEALSGHSCNLPSFLLPVARHLAAKNLPLW